MDPPEGFDPNRGWYQHPTTGQWIPIQLPARAAVPPPEEEPEEQQEANPPTHNAQPAPIRRGPPLPRPVFRPSSSQTQAPTFPTPPPTQSSTQHSNTYSFQPPAPVSRTPLGPEYDSLFEPIPSPSPEPETEAPAPVPRASRAAASTAKKPQKPEKGKKRAKADDGSASAPAPKRAKPTSSKAKPASKAKGKQPAKPASSGSASHGGRQPGSQNYTDDDLGALLHIVGDILPIGGNMWSRVEERFNIWARHNDRPVRTQKPLKTKFDQMARTPKPTGSAEIPPLIERAQEIEGLINAEVHLRDLDDSEIADVDEEGEVELEEVEEQDSECEIVEGPSATSKKKTSAGPVLKTFREQGSSGTSRQSSASRRAQVNGFMSAVTTSLDPAHREARDEARFARRAAQDEITRLTQDNRDLRNRYDSLSERYHQQTFAYQQAMGEVSRLQARLDVLDMVGAFTGGRTVTPTPRSRHTASWDYDPASRPYASPFPTRTFQSPAPRTPPSRTRTYRYSPADGGGYEGRQTDRWGQDSWEYPERSDFDMAPGASSPYDVHAPAPHHHHAPPVAGPSHSSSLPSTSTGTVNGQFAIATSMGGGLDALASVASSSQPRSSAAALDSTSITMTFTPSRRRRRNSTSSYEG